MRVGILGGSFDPVHHGHLIVAQALREVLGLDEVRLVPAHQQPFKEGRHGAGAHHRAAMLALAAEGEPGFAVDRRELDRPGPSYTVTTLRELRAAQPGDELVLLVGSDAAAALGAWRESAELPALATIVVFQRPGAAPAPAGAVPVPTVAISSTDVRARVRAGRSIRYWVPDAVANYIAAHRLYQDLSA